MDGWTDKPMDGWMHRKHQKRGWTEQTRRLVIKKKQMHLTPFTSNTDVSKYPLISKGRIWIKILFFNTFQLRVPLQIFQSNFAATRKLILRYSWLSLSRLRLSRITAYFEEKIWSSFSRINLTSGNKIRRSKVSPFPQYFQIIIFNLRGQITYLFVKFGCSICIFLNSANLICRNTDISKCFRGSLRLRDNEGWLYMQSETSLNFEI